MHPATLKKSGRNKFLWGSVLSVAFISAGYIFGQPLQVQSVFASVATAYKQAWKRNSASDSRLKIPQVRIPPHWPKRPHRKPLGRIDIRLRECIRCLSAPRPYQTKFPRPPRKRCRPMLTWIKIASL